MFLKTRYKMRDKNWDAYNFVGEVSEYMLKTVNIHKEVEPKLIFINQYDDIYSLKSGKDPKVNIVLFDDQYFVIKKYLKNGKNRNKRDNK